MFYLVKVSPIARVTSQRPEVENLQCLCVPWFCITCNYSVIVATICATIRMCETLLLSGIAMKWKSVMEMHVITKSTNFHGYSIYSYMDN